MYGFLAEGYEYSIHPKNMSHEVLAFNSGLNRTYISGIEHGIRNPSLLNVEKIAKALKISAISLV